MRILVDDVIFQTLEIHPKKVYDDSVLKFQKESIEAIKSRSKTSTSIPNMNILNQAETIDDFLNTDASMQPAIYTQTLHESPTNDHYNSLIRTPFAKVLKNTKQVKTPMIKPHLYDASSTFDDHARSTFGQSALEEHQKQFMSNSFHRPTTQLKIHTAAKIIKGFKGMIKRQRKGKLTLNASYLPNV